MIDSPGFILLLLVILIAEIGYILFDDPANSRYFRDYIDAIIVVVFICSVYFIFEYLRNQNKAPPRVTPIQNVAATELKKYQEEEMEKLTKSQEFTRFQEEKEQMRGDSEKRLSEEDEDFLRELEEKETEIFGSWFGKSFIFIEIIKFVGESSNFLWQFVLFSFARCIFFWSLEFPSGSSRCRIWINSSKFLLRFTFAWYMLIWAASSFIFFVLVLRALWRAESFSAVYNPGWRFMISLISSICFCFWWTRTYFSTTCSVLKINLFWRVFIFSFIS